MEVPDSLYKYMSSDTAKIVLESGKLRWSCPSTFNDISELQRMPAFSHPLAEGKTEYLSIIVNAAFSNENHTKPLSLYASTLVALIKCWKDQGGSKENILNELNAIDTPSPDLDQALREHTERHNDGSIRIFCLSEDDNNEVMWAHYGQNHTGCMFEFCHIEELDTPFSEAKKIQYTNEPPCLGSPVDFLLYGNSTDLLDLTSKAIYYSKTKNWSYEKEWRVMTRRVNEPKRYSDFKFYKQELASITFAANICPNIQHQLSDYINKNYPDSMLYKVFINRGKLERRTIEG